MLGLCLGETYPWLLIKVLQAKCGFHSLSFIDRERRWFEEHKRRIDDKTRLK